MPVCRVLLKWWPGSIATATTVAMPSVPRARRSLDFFRRRRSNHDLMALSHRQRCGGHRGFEGRFLGGIAMGDLVVMFDMPFTGAPDDCIACKSHWMSPLLCGSVAA